MVLGGSDSGSVDGVLRRVVEMTHGGEWLPDLDCSVLVVRGAANIDDLQQLGLPMAERFSKAELVILAPTNGLPAHVVKGRVTRDSMDFVQFIDADSRLGVLAETIERIANAYRVAKPEYSHLAHAHVGLFLCFGYIGHPSPDTPRPMLEVVRAGEMDLLQRAAEEYIESGFESLFFLRGLESQSDDRVRATTGRSGSGALLPRGPVPNADGKR